MGVLDHLRLPERDEPLSLPWPMPGVGVGFLRFDNVDHWKGFIGTLDLHPGVPKTVSRKYERAQRLLCLAWMDFDIIIASELVALTALELALKDRYGGKPNLDQVSIVLKNKKKNAKPKTADEVKKQYGQKFAVLLCYMAELDGLTNDNLPSVKRIGGNAIGRLTGEAKPSIAEIRNTMAHGDPFDGLPNAGLIELVRDLIHYAFRDMIREYQPMPSWCEGATGEDGADIGEGIGEEEILG